MKNKKGFTLVELLAVIVIMGILSAIAITSITRYHQNVNNKEKMVLKSSIESAFSNYMLTNGKPSTSNKISDDDKEYINAIYISNLSFDGDISYNNNKCTNNGGDSLGYIVLVKNSDYELVVKNKYNELVAENKYDDTIDSYYIYYGICKIKTTYNGKNTVTQTCEKDDSGKIVLSEETTYCIKFTCNSEEVINDFKDANSICSYAE